ncbi:Hypothetical_protein [Hexamita inflata]|uniref:Hypothetical_protein n=1 Tax=Hexamita inflata TaxID=28002 RepID=A0AA86PF31_9EUKA|nr:Hypothetical protein HINF_LOCUS22239 [Hexamita inflata]
MSSCETQLRISAASVHQFNPMSVSLTKVQPDNVFFAHKQFPWINKRVKFQLETDGFATVWVCQAPVLINIVVDCKFVMSKGSAIEIDVEADQFDFYTNYLYYTVQSSDSDKLIKAEITDVFKIDVNDSKILKIEEKNQYTTSFLIIYRQKPTLRSQAWILVQSFVSQKSSRLQKKNASQKSTRLVNTTQPLNISQFIPFRNSARLNSKQRFRSTKNQKRRRARAGQYGSLLPLSKWLLLQQRFWYSSTLNTRRIRYTPTYKPKKRTSCLMIQSDFDYNK